MPRCGAGTGGSGGLASELGRADDDDYKPWIAGARRAPTGRGGLRGATITSTPLTTASGVHGRGVNVAAVLRNQAVPEPEHVAAGKASPPSRRVYCTSNSAIKASPSLQTFSTSCRKPATDARNALTASTNADSPWTGSALPRRRRTSSVMNAASAETSLESKAAHIWRTWSVGLMASCWGLPFARRPLGRSHPRDVAAFSRRLSWESRFGSRVLRGPRRASSARTAATSLRSVGQGSVEVDRGVCAIAERLVRRVSATAHHHRVGMFDHMPVRGGEDHGAGDHVGAVFGRGDGDVGHGGDLS